MPGPAVGDGQRTASRRRAADDADDDGRAGLAVLAGVVQQVVEELAEQRAGGRGRAAGASEASSRDVGARGGGPTSRRGGRGTQAARSIDLAVGERRPRRRRGRGRGAISTIWLRCAAWSRTRPRTPPVLVGRAVAAEGDVDLAEHGGQRRAELVRGVAGEPRLALERLVEAVEQAVEGVGQVVQLVAGAGARGAGGRGRRPRPWPRGLGHPRTSGRRARRQSRRPTRRGQQPESRREPARPAADAGGSPRPARARLAGRSSDG